MRIHALLFFFFAQSAFALYGGRPSVSDRHLVKLQVSQDTFCQGVVIAPDKVLTSAHCIEGKGQEIRETSLLLTYYPESVTVVSGRQRVQAKAITLAPSYFDSSTLNAEDLALIELSSPLKNVDILPFANKAHLTPGANVQLSSNQEVADTKILRRFTGLGGLVILSDGSQVGVCQGDSGGALILVKDGKKYLAGILSVQAHGCTKRHSVSYYPKNSL